MTAFVVVNPRSGNGATGRAWKTIERGLRASFPHLTAVASTRRGETAQLVREALNEGHREIIAVGGDGTINEAVNGFFGISGPRAPDAVFGFVTSGTGGDFRKSYGVAGGIEAAIARLSTAAAHPVDVGRVTCLGPQGKPLTRHFINIASFGLSGVIVDRVNRARIAKLFGGRFAFRFHSAVSMLSHRGQTVRIRIDGEYDEIASISTVAIANGQYFGGGMRVAPDARTTDGLFDIVILGGGPKSQALAGMKLLETGEHVHLPSVRVVRGRKVLAVPVAETKGHAVLVETDGESAGRLPATFEILPRALNLRC